MEQFTDEEQNRNDAVPGPKAPGVKNSRKLPLAVEYVNEYESNVRVKLASFNVKLAPDWVAVAGL